MFRGLGVADDSFEGAGHRLGGKKGPVMLGDLQRHADRMRDAGKINEILCNFERTSHTLR